MPYAELNLTRAGVNGAAREAALRAAAEVSVEPTSLLGYRSAGFLLIVGPERAALGAADRLRQALRVTVVATSEEEPLDEALEAVRADERVVFLRGRLASLDGHLGNYSARLDTPQGESLNISELNDSGHPYFDLVLDLQPEPQIRHQVPPFGYYPVSGDAARLERALDEIPEMTGEFEKPKFFNYNPDICAHGDSGLTGCTRCIDNCPTGAIASIGEMIEVDPYLCQGGGSCATGCPTGAMIYAYPGPKDQLARLRRMLAAYRDAGGETPVLLFHDEDAGLGRLAAAAAFLPGHVLPVEVAELGAVGMDTWLSALAYGASAVVLLDTPQVPASVRRELNDQLSFTRPMLEAMGYSDSRLRLLPATEDLASALSAEPEPALAPAAFDTFNEKRGTLRLALDHLYEQGAQRPVEVALPKGAPFGQVLVDEHACTLCMACPQVCPTHALSDAGDKPQLNFTEDLCVQCGLCSTACPENAITLDQRFLFDWEQRRRPRVLNEEEPFCCISCGKPFATGSVIRRMTEKLEGHHMFQSADAVRRLKMCGDCRVTDMFQDDLEDAPKPRWFGPQ
ncbi:MAG: 4Fe-4S binding protein [Ectothiorhodospiraceae bacterium]|nr:4Fe-4S binding protein [Ectothiorhodospiraceae bacterium]